MLAVADAALGNALQRVEIGVGGLLLVLGADELHLHLLADDGGVRIRTGFVVGRVAELGPAFALGGALRHLDLGDLVRAHHLHLLVIVVVLVLGDDLGAVLQHLSWWRQTAGVQQNLVRPGGLDVVDGWHVVWGCAKKSARMRE